MVQPSRRLVQPPANPVALARLLVVCRHRVAAIAAWYAHAYQLGQNSGLTFGFWGGGDRSSLGLLLDLETWFNLSIRVALRLLAIAGVPFLIGGIWIGRRCSGGRIAISGLLGVLLCTLATMRSSSIHEYYQLPFCLPAP